MKKKLLLLLIAFAALDPPTASALSVGEEFFENGYWYGVIADGKLEIVGLTPDFEGGNNLTIDSEYFDTSSGFPDMMSITRITDGAFGACAGNTDKAITGTKTSIFYFRNLISNPNYLIH